MLPSATSLEALQNLTIEKYQELRLLPEGLEKLCLTHLTSKQCEGLERYALNPCLSRCYNLEYLTIEGVLTFVGWPFRHCKDSRIIASRGEVEFTYRYPLPSPLRIHQVES
jgi:hypothetical protein